VKIVAYVIALILFLGGMAMFGYAFHPGVPGYPVFLGGILAVALSLAIPFHLLKAADR
jgi:hypothetical protein